MSLTINNMIFDITNAATYRILKLVKFKILNIAAQHANWAPSKLSLKYLRLITGFSYSPSEQQKYHHRQVFFFLFQIYKS